VFGLGQKGGQHLIKPKHWSKGQKIKLGIIFRGRLIKLRDR